jgi:hypothetical protein
VARRRQAQVASEWRGSLLPRAGGRRARDGAAAASAGDRRAVWVPSSSHRWPARGPPSSADPAWRPSPSGYAGGVAGFGGEEARSRGREAGFGLLLVLAAGSGSRRGGGGADSAGKAAAVRAAQASVGPG